MKKVSVLIVTMIVIPALIFGQGKNIGEVIAKYKDDKNAQTVKIDPGSFEINGGVEKNAAEALEALNDINEIIIMSLDSSHSDYNTFLREAEKAVKNDGFTEMMRIDEGNEHVFIYLLESKTEKGRYSDFLVLSMDENEASLVYMNGLIPIAQALGMLENLNFGSGENENTPND